MGGAREVIFFIAVDFIISTSVCMAATYTNTKFFELQSEECVIGAVKSKGNVSSRIQCLDICLQVSRHGTDNEMCTAAQYFDQTKACQLYVYRGQPLPIICGPLSPAVFASPLMGPFVIYPGPATWSQAKTACTSTGGMLACITTKVQNDLVGGLLETRGFANTDTWLGASKSTAGSFTWVNQQAFGFTSFSAAEPSGRLTENCLVSRYAAPTLEWYDRECDQAYVYICEY